MKHDYILGELPGHPVGSWYPNRNAAMWAGLHASGMHGISGQPDEGADCIALSEGYVDDQDHGTWVIYTGTGGNDATTKRQIADQTFEHPQNASLVYSEEHGLPVRVLRGHQLPLGPAKGYRYDGLYKVVSHWTDTGVDGFQICRYRLERLAPEEATPWTPADQQPATGPVGDYNGPVENITLEVPDGTVVRTVEFTRPAVSGAPAPAAPKPPVKRSQTATKPAGTHKPARATGVVQRLVRNNAVSQWVKDVNGHICQFCELLLDLPVGSYSEGAHIRPVGSPHFGPDTTDNMLCLCPNHHVLFDKGAIYIDEHLTVRDHHGNAIGALLGVSVHVIDAAHIAYHREHHGFGG